MRNLLRHKLYSLINVFGLAVGLTCVLLIYLFVRHELSYDRYHPGSDRTYRLSLEFDGQTKWASNNYWLIPTLLESLPEVERGARLMGTSIPVARNGEVFKEAHFLLADPEIFDLFYFEWLQGDAGSALAAPFTLVLTESMALKYFGDENPMGQTLVINNQAPVKVTGVIADLAENSHLKADFFTAMQTGVLAYGENNLAGGFNFHSYIRLKPGVYIESLSSQITELMLTRMGPAFQGRTEVISTALEDVHFTPMNNELSGSTAGSMMIVYIFSSIAAGILLIACINFINLSTARSVQRAREVGMRKVVGARRGQLIMQFIGESIVMALLAVLITLMLAESLVPLVQSFTGLKLDYELINNGPHLAMMLGLAIFCGLLAGSYPAFHLAAYKPEKVLRGNVDRSKSGSTFRNTLVVLQFSIAIVLLASFAVIYLQTQFARNIDSGFDKEQLIVLEGSVTDGLGRQWEAMKQSLISHPQVLSVTGSSSIPGPDFQTASWSVRNEGSTEPVDLSFLSVDFNFFETYGVSLISGRTFDESQPNDRMRFEGENPGASYILNEMAVRQLGWTPQEAVSKWIEWGADGRMGGPRGSIVGVVNDANFGSVRNSETPLVYIVGRSQYQALSFNYATLKVSGENMEDTLAFIDQTWAQFMPGHPVSRSFVEQNISLMYQKEERQGELLRYFSILAVIIACLGLYGLATYNAERRTKEIGVRKVMGSSVMRIVLLLTNDFSKLVLLSNIIAWPVAYFAMNRWLEQFSYRIDLTPLIFLGSGLIALCIAWVTVGGTAAKAASQKPVLALRYE